MNISTVLWAGPLRRDVFLLVDDCLHSIPRLPAIETNACLRRTAVATMRARWTPSSGRETRSSPHNSSRTSDSESSRPLIISRSWHLTALHLRHSMIVSDAVSTGWRQYGKEWLGTAATGIPEAPVSGERIGQSVRYDDLRHEPPC